MHNNNTPLHDGSTSTPMTCSYIIFNVLYQTDPCLIHNMIVGSLDRLQDTSCQLPLHDHQLLRAAFFILLNKDEVLKQSTLKGNPQFITPLDRLKAAAFFIALKDESIWPFLSNKSTGTEEFIDKIKHLYLAV